MSDVLIIGELNPDIIVSGTDLRPRFDQTETVVESVRLTVGGSGAITACGLARLDVPVALLAVVGDDELGALMQQRIAERGVDTSWVRTDVANATGATVVLAEPSERAMFTYPGTIAAVTPTDLDKVDAGAARHVHVSSYFLMSPETRRCLPAVLRRLRQAGVTTSADTNFDPTGRWETHGLIDEVDILFPNRAEAHALSGVTGGTAAAQRLASTVPTVVVKLGADGAMVATRDRIERLAPPDEVDVVDAVGAGDTFDAAYLAAWFRGWPADRCLAWAVAAGTLSTRARGGVDGQPTAAELGAQR